MCYGNLLTRLDVSNNILLERLECFNNQLTSLDFKRTKDILPYIDEMFEVFSASYSKLWLGHGR